MQADGAAGAAESRRSRREAEYFNRIADEQTEAWWGHLTPAGRHRDQRRAEQVLAGCRFSPGMMGLEIGCGGGSFAANYSRLLPRDVKVTAVDIAERLIERARRRDDLSPGAEISFEVADVERLDCPDAHFDSVFGSSILHHLDLGEALPELVRVLKPGGRFCFAEPNMANPEVFLTRNIDYFRRRSQTSQDETAFFRRAIARRLKRHGLTKIDVRPFDFLHPKTPEPLIELMQRLGRAAESTPLLREISGSLLIVAEKPTMV